MPGIVLPERCDLASLATVLAAGKAFGRDWQTLPLTVPGGAFVSCSARRMGYPSAIPPRGGTLVGPLANHAPVAYDQSPPRCDDLAVESRYAGRTAQADSDVVGHTGRDSRHRAPPGGGSGHGGADR